MGSKTPMKSSQYRQSSIKHIESTHAKLKSDNNGRAPNESPKSAEEGAKVIQKFDSVYLEPLNDYSNIRQHKSNNNVTQDEPSNELMHDKNCGPDEVYEPTKEENDIGETYQLSSPLYQVNTPVVMSPHLDRNPNEVL